MPVMSSFRPAVQALVSACQMTLQSLHLASKHILHMRRLHAFQLYDLITGLWQPEASYLHGSRAADQALPGSLGCIAWRFHWLYVFLDSRYLKRFS